MEEEESREKPKAKRETNAACAQKKKVYLNFNKAQTAWGKLEESWGLGSEAPSYGGSLSCYVHRTTAAMAAAFAFISVARNIWNGALLISVMNYWCAQHRLHSWLIQGINQVRPLPQSLPYRRAILIVYLHLHSKVEEEAATDIFIVPQRQRRMHKSLKCCTYIIIRHRERERWESAARLRRRHVPISETAYGTSLQRVCANSSKSYSTCHIRLW